MTTINLEQFTNKEIKQVIMECRTKFDYSRKALSEILHLPEHRILDLEIQAINEYSPPWIDKA